MVAPTLNDYEYQYKDAGVGVLLNGQAALPFWDITKVEGLADFPDLSVDALELDGRHGSFISGKFFQHRVITFEGTLYADVNQVDAQLRTFRTSILPDDIDYPLYWKHPNLTQSYYLCKPSSFRADVEQGRRTGMTDFQLQFMAGDPRAFVDIATVAWTSGVNATVNNIGNVMGPLVVNITASSTTTANITVSNQTQSRSVQFTTAVTVGQVVSIDVDNWIVTVGGTVRPVNFVVTGDWPYLQAGSQAWRVTSNIGNGNIVAKSAWL